MSGAYWLGVVTVPALAAAGCLALLAWARIEDALAERGVWIDAKVRNTERISDYILRHNIWWERSFGPVFVGGWYREEAHRLATRWIGFGQANGRCLMIGHKRDLGPALEAEL